jgi:hypothetical protein
VHITDAWAFSGNVVAFVAAAAKTLYDLIFNNLQFSSEKKGPTYTVKEAASRKRDRANLSTVLAFLLVAVGFALSIWSLIH